MAALRPSLTPAPPKKLPGNTCSDREAGGQHLFTHEAEGLPGKASRRRAWSRYNNAVIAPCVLGRAFTPPAGQCAGVMRYEISARARHLPHRRMTALVLLRRCVLMTLFAVGLRVRPRQRAHPSHRLCDQSAPHLSSGKTGAPGKLVSRGSAWLGRAEGEQGPGSPRLQLMSEQSATSCVVHPRVLGAPPPPASGKVPHANLLNQTGGREDQRAPFLPAQCSGRGC
ncbi:hypothetical protein AAFF_G00336960 [Aldrovandia affinis]|uniref:Uncharacterized protein n=1 Tax=Aldrovandia affinis TaxID=143900 RepID=A0AAD7WQA2_9TELE|nr:hypothetical protein AAFF_G00336960 [Aldrovandia affinis]